MPTKKVVLITGASSGIGKAVASYLSSKDMIVYGTSRLKLEPISFNHVIMDVSSSTSVETAIQMIIVKEGRIDILINNAGVGLAGAIEETSINEAKNQFETNFFGVVRVTQAVLRYMRNQNNGIIINVSSLAGIISLPFQGFYSSSKFALEGFTEALRIELKPFNIEVTNINPGDFQTDFTSNRIFIEQSQHKDSVYASKLIRTAECFEKDELNGANPILVAKLIYKIVNKKSLKVRYSVGSISQRSSVILKKLLPSKWFEKLLMAHYNLN